MHQNPSLPAQTTPTFPFPPHVLPLRVARKNALRRVFWVVYDRSNSFRGVLFSVFIWWFNMLCLYLDINN